MRTNASACPVCLGEALIRKPLHANFLKISCAGGCGDYGITLAVMGKLKVDSGELRQRLQRELVQAVDAPYRIDIRIDSSRAVITERRQKRVWDGV